MTYDEYIEQEGVALPIAGFEDLVFDYLEALNDEGYDVPVDNIIHCIFATQEIVPMVEEINSEAVKDPKFMQSIERGGDSVH